MERAGSRRPNVVYILADDMGYGDMGCQNPGSKIPTPWLDRLASEGTRFSNAHASSSVCTPSRYAILTGRYGWRSALKRSVLWSWDEPLVEPGRMTVAGLLKGAGYRTACVGKWHLGWDWRTVDGGKASEGLTIGLYDAERRKEVSKRVDFSARLRGGPLDCGFEEYFGVDVPNFPPYGWFEGDRVVSVMAGEKPEGTYGFPGPAAAGWDHEAVMPEITKRAVKYIEGSGEEPFFLYFALTAPHTPIAPTAEFVGKSGAGLYGDFVCQVDASVGEVMQALERRGIADNTLVIFTSDNGPECWPAESGTYHIARNFGHYSMAELRGAKRDAWEGGHRVPFVVRWPGVTPAGAVCDGLVELGDLMATCAEIVGVSEGIGEDSRSMLGLLEGRFGEVTREFSVHHSCSGHFAIRKGEWVFIDSPRGLDADNAEPEWFRKERGYVGHDFAGELFCLTEDVGERVNRYGERPEVVAEMKGLLERVKGGEVARGVGEGLESE